MAREAVSAYFIVLVVVEHEGRYLLIHEASHGQTWYLPAGRVEPGPRGLPSLGQSVIRRFECFGGQAVDTARRAPH